jgi:AcrR family transcriptional regulator
MAKSARSTELSGAIPPQRSATQRRTIDAALKLFGKHGVSGTSLQMIADSVGLTKASIYYQFATKEEIVLAATEEPLARIAAAIDAAESAPDPDSALDAILPVLVDQAVESRAIARFLQTDPEIVRIMAEHKRYRLLMERRDAILQRGRDTPETRVRAATVVAVLAAPAQPLVAGLDDDTLRDLLTELAREILHIAPDTHADHRRNAKTKRAT